MLLKMKELLQIQSVTRNQKFKSKHLTKFQRMYTEKMESVINSTQQTKPTQIKSVHNFSGYELTDTDHRLLELGLNYAIPIRSQNTLMIEAGLNI